MFRRIVFTSASKDEVPDPSGIDIEELASRYERVFHSESSRHRQRLDELEARHERLLDGMLNIPSSAKLAVAKAQQKLAEVEADIAETKALLENASDLWLDAMNEVVRQMKGSEAARQAVNEDASHRRRAEAVRKVVFKIVLTFEPTGKKRPLTELVKVEVVAANPRPPASHRSASRGSDLKIGTVESGCRCP